MPCTGVKEESRELMKDNFRHFQSEVTVEQLSKNFYLAVENVRLDF